MSDMNETTKAETNRDRVRRLLIEPLTRDGMRFPREVSDEVQRKRLDQMADDLGHMSDGNLVRLRLCLRSKGGGSAKCFWPGRVTIVGFAEVAASRAPFRTIHACAAGLPLQRAARRRRYRGGWWPSSCFFRAPQAPAVRAGAHAAHRAEGCRDGGACRTHRGSRGSGAVSSPDDVAWIVWYRQVHDMLLSWLTEEGEAA